MSDVTYEENIFLGGQISNKHKEFQTIAQLDADSAFIVLFLDHYEELKKLTPLKKVREIMFLIGQINFMMGCGELTKLSAILGDTRQRYSSKELPDVLRKLRLSSNPPANP